MKKLIAAYSIFTSFIIAAFILVFTNSFVKLIYNYLPEGRTVFTSDAYMVDANRILFIIIILSFIAIFTLIIISIVLVLLGNDLFPKIAIFIIVGLITIIFFVEVAFIPNVTSQEIKEGYYRFEVYYIIGKTGGTSIALMLISGFVGVPVIFNLIRRNV